MGAVPIVVQDNTNAKLVGGVSYASTLRGDGQAPPAPVEARTQRAALDAAWVQRHADTIRAADALLLPFEQVKDVVGFNAYYREEDRYKTDDQTDGHVVD